MNKRLESRDEPVLEPDLPIIDAHHHLFLRPDLRYLLDDYLDDARAGHGIVASVYVETLAFARTDGPEVLRPLSGVEFANGVGAMTAGGALGDVRVCAGIVGHADMRLGDGFCQRSRQTCGVSCMTSSATRPRGWRAQRWHDEDEAGDGGRRGHADCGGCGGGGSRGVRRSPDRSARPRRSS